MPRKIKDTRGGSDLIAKGARRGLAGFVAAGLPEMCD